MEPAAGVHPAPFPRADAFAPLPDCPAATLAVGGGSGRSRTKTRRRHCEAGAATSAAHGQAAEWLKAHAVAESPEKARQQDARLVGRAGAWRGSRRLQRHRGALLFPRQADRRTAGRDAAPGGVRPDPAGGLPSDPARSAGARRSARRASPRLLDPLRAGRGKRLIFARRDRAAGSRPAQRQTDAQKSVASGFRLS